MCSAIHGISEKVDIGAVPFESKHAASMRKTERRAKPELREIGPPAQTEARRFAVAATVAE